MLFRYLDPMGENPNSSPNNLMPYITQVAAGKRESWCFWQQVITAPEQTGLVGLWCL